MTGKMRNPCHTWSGMNENIKSISISFSDSRYPQGFEIQIPETSTILSVWCSSLTSNYSLREIFEWRWWDWNWMLLRGWRIERMRKLEVGFSAESWRFRKTMLVEDKVIFDEISITGSILLVFVTIDTKVMWLLSLNIVTSFSSRWNYIGKMRVRWRIG